MAYAAIAAGRGPAHASSLDAVRTYGGSGYLTENGTERDLRDAIGGLLQAQGHAVTHVGHGLAALTEVATRRFDAALLDLDLPGMDGLALARMLRAQGHTLPLMAVTARSDGEAEAQAREAGFDGFLRKPVTGAMLAEAIDALRRDED